MLELITDSVPLDFTQSHLLPPPSEYCKNDDNEEEYYDDDEDHPHETESYSSEVCLEQAAAQNRRMSMIPQMIDSPFRRDDIRRQSMPVYGQTEKLIDGFGPRSSFRRRDKVSCFPDEPPPVRDQEQEIFIDFKPHVSPKPSPKLQLKHRKQHKAEIAMRKMQQQRMAQAAALTLPKLKPHPQPQPQPLPVEVEVRKVELEPSDEEEEEEDEEASEPEEEEIDDDEEIDEDEHKLETDHPEDEEPLYENIIPCNCKVEPPQSDLEDLQDKRSQFRKRSVSLDDDYAAATAAGPPPACGLRLPSTPASPCREDLLLANVSTYPSSDSLANDNTRDHSDGIWNESQVTVLTAEQRDISDGSYSSNLLLTPSSKRKNLLLQHQQRSSVDTDALDFEEQVAWET